LFALHGLTILNVTLSPEGGRLVPVDNATAAALLVGCLCTGDGQPSRLSDLPHEREALAAADL
jgi:hypothetical protein